MITEQQSQMIDYIIEGNNKSDTAKLLGVSRQTVYEWLKIKEIQAEKQKRLTDIKVTARNRIATKVNNCVDIIYDIAVKSKETRTKFAAAKYLCDQFIGAPATERPAREEQNKDITVEIIPSIDDMLAEIDKENNISEGEPLPYE